MTEAVKVMVRCRPMSIK